MITTSLPFRDNYSPWLEVPQDPWLPPEAGDESGFEFAEPREVVDDSHQFAEAREDVDDGPQFAEPKEDEER